MGNDRTQTSRKKRNCLPHSTHHDVTCELGIDFLRRTCAGGTKSPPQGREGSSKAAFPEVDSFRGVLHLADFEKTLAVPSLSLFASNKFSFGTTVVFLWGVERREDLDVWAPVAPGPSLTWDSVKLRAGTSLDLPRGVRGDCCVFKMPLSAVSGITSWEAFILWASFTSGLKLSSPCGR
mmetsp:Transcript_27636/g.38161  ORF Transcript_27636/g.38161 Transcript_27636/m.38161 type:complete len:179 (-) Transcript_27636:1035-1571(-)